MANLWPVQAKFGRIRGEMARTRPFRYLHGRMVILACAIAAGCSRGAPDESASPDDTAPPDDSGGMDPCEDPPAPSDYVNVDFATTTCTFNGFPPPALEMASALLSLPDMRMQYFAAVEDDVFPNVLLYVEWYEERGANPYPSESILEAAGWANAPVLVFVVDCPTKDSADCVYYFSTSGRAYYSKGGLCPYTSHESRLVGFVDQVVMAQADVDIDAGTSTWVDGGETWCLERYDFDLFLDHL